MAVAYISWSCKSGGDLALNTTVNKLRTGITIPCDKFDQIDPG